MLYQFGCKMLHVASFTQSLPASSYGVPTSFLGIKNKSLFNLLFFARPKKSNKRKDALSRGISSHADAREEPSPKLRLRSFCALFFRKVGDSPKVFSQLQAERLGHPKKERPWRLAQRHI